MINSQSKANSPDRARWLVVLLLGGAGAAIILYSLLVPAHFRAVDTEVLEYAGRETETIVESGLSLVGLEKIGPAKLMLDAANIEQIKWREKLEQSIRGFTKAHPELMIWGGGDPYLEPIFRNHPRIHSLTNRPVMEIFILRDSREALLDYLQQSRQPAVQVVLGNRHLTNTVYFPPVQAASGQAFETAILLAALLMQGDHFAPSFREKLQILAAQATGGVEETRPLEMIYLDLISLAKRFDWIQLREFIQNIEDPITLRNLTHLVRIHQEDSSVIFAAVHLSQNPRAVTEYLLKYSDTGIRDLGNSLAFRTGGVRELLQRQQRVYYPTMRSRVNEYEPFYSLSRPLVQIASFAPGLGSGLQYIMLLVGGFLLARTSAYWHTLSLRDQEFHLPQIGAVRQGLFALTLTLLAMIFSEPFLAQENQTMQFPLQISLPFEGSPMLSQIQNSLAPNMDQITWLTLGVFFVIQLIIYAVCLVKLAEIKRQPMPSDVKLKLLDNEEAMFDAGLYFGLGGTVLALVFLALNIIAPSLMAAYASTLFGIIFVALLKICHLRPFRRQLILDCEAQGNFS